MGIREIPHRLGQAARWLGDRPALLLLTADDGRLSREPGERFQRAWIGLLVLAGLAGLGLCATWWLAEELFGFFSGNIPLLPVAAVAGVHLLGLHRRSVGALAAMLVGRDRAGRSTASAVIVLVVVLALLDQPTWNDDWPAWHLGAWQWIRPQVTYRTLLLMPLWGTWAMLLVGQMVRPTDRTSPAVAHLSRGCGPVWASATMALPLAASLQYYNYLPWIQVAISGAPILTAAWFGPLFGRLTGGLRRCTLLAVNLLTQVVFLLAQVSVRHAAGH